MLVLREDMTVPIARICASKFGNAMPPFRIRYCSDVYKVRHAFAGRRNEVTDCGIELIGMDESGDLEVLVSALDVMACLESPKWSLEIGNSQFFRKACTQIHLNKEQEKQLADLTDRKALPDLEAFLDTLPMKQQEKDFFMHLPLLGGSRAILREAEQVSFSDDLRNEVKKLQDLDEKLTVLGYGEHLAYDFGKIPHLGYYTGILFEGYTANSSTSVLSGGRYDHLLAKFGRDLPACGFSVKLDYLLDGFPRNAKPSLLKLCYPKGKEAEAIQKARELRKENPVELCPWEKTYMEVIQ